MNKISDYQSGFQFYRHEKRSRNSRWLDIKANLAPTMLDLHWCKPAEVEMTGKTSIKKH